jgi:hypothetical protein
VNWLQIGCILQLSFHEFFDDGSTSWKSGNMQTVSHFRKSWKTSEMWKIRFIEKSFVCYYFKKMSVRGIGIVLSATRPVTWFLLTQVHFSELYGELSLNSPRSDLKDSKLASDIDIPSNLGNLSCVEVGNMIITPVPAPNRVALRSSKVVEIIAEFNDRWWSNRPVSSRFSSSKVETKLRQLVNTGPKRLESSIAHKYTD